MRNITFKIGIFILVTCSWGAGAQANVITESITGTIRSHFNCRIQSADLADVKFQTNRHDELLAALTWNYSCRTITGRIRTFTVTKHVDFEDLVFDRTSNTWVIDGESIAKKKGKCCAELLPGYLYTIWSQLDEGEGLSFHVMIEKPEGADGE